MLIESERRRAVIAAGPEVGEQMRQLFTRDPLDRWDTLEADSFSRARFLLQHDTTDLMVVSDDLYEREGGQGLAWIAWKRETPIVFLAGPSALNFQKAYELGASVCLPRALAMEYPPLLATAMDQALQTAELRGNFRKTTERLTECRQHVDRLVNMLWRNAGRQSDMQWFSQRYMLERLGEELARVERHQVPLTIALGEVLPEQEEPADDSSTMPDWTRDMIAKGKRRCDVAGEYGPGGFMLLMVQTPIRGGVHCCRRIQKTIEHPAEPLPMPHNRFNAFFGVSSTATGKISAATLLRSAEQNLEAARADNRERIMVD